MNTELMKQIGIIIAVMLFIFVLGVSFGMYVTHPLIYANINNNTVSCNLAANALSSNTVKP